jgi:hypothetical protein
MPLFETDVSEHKLRLKQHGLRFPDLSIAQAFSILLFRVSGCLVERIQRIQSQRECGVISFHTLYAVGTAVKAFLKSVGRFGSNHSLIGSITISMVSPAHALVDFSMDWLNLSQWLPLPSV